MVTNLIRCMFCGGVLEDMGSFVQCTNPRCERVDPNMIEIDSGRPNQRWQPTHCRHRACQRELTVREMVMLHDECMECARGSGIDR
jgi:hypothetical protein